ncbi:MAG: uroporphyrinogen-III synthase [Flavobacteriaceae bacterium]|nr:uroporphyrinogen-III synthase [Flavobacteriaceae bacterium]
MSAKSILSTKRLSKSQEDILVNAGLSFETYNAIKISFIDFQVPKNIDNAIFTSQNGVNSFFQHKGASTHIKECFCVGDKTEIELKENGQNIVKKSRNASELAHFIVNNHKNESFYYICGSHRRNEIPQQLKNEKISIIELKTYRTELKPKYFDQKWSKIMFFSPTGVESFVEGQKITENGVVAMPNYFADTTAICIGDTTAATAKKYIRNVIVANSTTVESVIATTVKTMMNDEN